MRFIMLSAVAPLLLAGCIIQNAERDTLPNGVTLLDSDQGYCDGPVQIEPNHVIDDGENTIVTLNGDTDVEWQCLADTLRDDDGEIDCPVGTSYLRVSREEDSPEFTVECFGA